MSTLNINPKTIREGNGTDTIFSFDFPAVEKTDIQVFVKRGEEEKQIPYGQFDFNVEPTADNGGEIIFPGANSAEAVLGVGEKICIMRSSRFGNDYIFSNQSRLFPSSVEDADDALSLQILELANRLSLSVQASVFDTTTPTERWKHIQNELKQAQDLVNYINETLLTLPERLNAEAEARAAADRQINASITSLEENQAQAAEDFDNTVLQLRTERYSGDTARIEKILLPTAVTGVIGKNTATSVGLEVSSANTDTGTVSASTVALPVASATQHGVMPKEAYATLSNLGTRVTALEGGQSKTYAVSLGTGELTQQDYQTAWEQASGAIAGATPPDGTKLTNLDTDTDIQYFANSGEWIVRGVSVPLATQNSQGVVMGSEDQGKVFIEEDGTMSVVGFEDHDNNINMVRGDLLDESNRATAAEATLTGELRQHVNDTARHTTSAEKQVWNGKYTKPSTGIPATDLDSATQEVLLDALRKSTGGVVQGQLVARNASALDDFEVRNIKAVAAADDPGVGSALAAGNIILVYE